MLLHMGQKGQGKTLLQCSGKYFRAVPYIPEFSDLPQAMLFGTGYYLGHSKQMSFSASKDGQVDMSYSTYIQNSFAYNYNTICNENIKPSQDGKSPRCAKTPSQHAYCTSKMVDCQHKPFTEDQMFRCAVYNKYTNCELLEDGLIGVKHLDGFSHSGQA